MMSPYLLFLCILHSTPDLPPSDIIPVCFYDSYYRAKHIEESPSMPLKYLHSAF